MRAAEIIDQAQRCRFCGAAAEVRHKRDCPDPAFLAPLPDSLDAAWAEAEAALPDGWGVGIERAPGGYQAGAGRNEWAIWDGQTHPTPAAALRSLAVKLRADLPT